MMLNNRCRCWSRGVLWCMWQQQGDVVWSLISPLWTSKLRFSNSSCPSGLQQVKFCTAATRTLPPCVSAGCRLSCSCGRSDTGKEVDQLWTFTAEVLSSLDCNTCVCWSRLLTNWSTGPCTEWCNCKPGCRYILPLSCDPSVLMLSNGASASASSSSGAMVVAATVLVVLAGPCSSKCSNSCNQ